MSAERHRRRIPHGNALAACGQCLVGYVDVTRGIKGLRVSPASHQNMVDYYIRFLHLREAAGLPYKPKKHLGVHLVLEAKHFGNPLRTGTWVDEGLNMLLRDVGSCSHPLVWTRRVLSTFSHQDGPTEVLMRGGIRKRHRQ